MPYAAQRFADSYQFDLELANEQAEESEEDPEEMHSTERNDEDEEKCQP